MKTYIIDDLRKSAFGDPIKVEAKSPIEAVKKIYPTAKRVYEGGNIVVYGYSHNRYIDFQKAYVYDTEEV